MEHTMKTTGHKDDSLNVAFDVSVEKLNFYTEVAGES